MVEAAIYVPLVLCVVVSMLYLGLFYMQEAAMNCQVQRMTIYASKDAANPGYSSFPISGSNDIEFDFGGSGPSASQVKSYYQAYHNTPGALYRGISGIFSGSNYDYDSLMTQLANNGLLFRFTIHPSVEVEKSLFGTSILATVEYETPMPGVARFLGLEDTMVIRSASYSHAVNPADFIRNTDLAVDLVTFAAEKLGLSDSLSGLINKSKSVINTLF